MLEPNLPVIENLLDGCEKIIRGKRDFLKLTLSALFAGGHLLLEDVPGLGKTTVAKTIAKLIGGGYCPPRCEASGFYATPRTKLR
ncbi:MAG: hypothetical protein Ta2G_06400 [Termitinemataceae bacterium]|nr:MAG: hypothetical protein Ta2G_06400 [Termitinemataceae bacterium]